MVLSGGCGGCGGMMIVWRGVSESGYISSFVAHRKPSYTLIRLGAVVR